MNTISTRIPRHDVKIMADEYENIDDQFDQISGSQRSVIHDLINLQFSDLSKRIKFYFVDNEPYGQNPTLKEMLQDFRGGYIYIHTTGNESRMWGEFHNLQFRAIHDYIHCIQELDFNHASECKAFQAQVEFSLQKRYTKRFPHLNWDKYVRVLRSEIVYQSAFKEATGAFHIDQKIILDDFDKCYKALVDEDSGATFGHGQY